MWLEFAALKSDAQRMFVRKEGKMSTVEACTSLTAKYLAACFVLHEHSSRTRDIRTSELLARVAVGNRLTSSRCSDTRLDLSPRLSMKRTQAQNGCLWTVAL